MKKYTIPQKMSGTGTIHDLASQHYDREILFPKGHKYAVILADYYGGEGYTTHTNEADTIAASKRESEYSHAIIDQKGNHYSCFGDKLRRV